MARLASVQIAGYYPSPKDLLSSFASTLRLEERHRGYQPLTFFDPCAGDGEAIDTLRSHWLAQLDREARHGRVVACDMEGERARSLEKRLGPCDIALHGDAFHLHWKKADTDEFGVNVLFLNPPYDYDREYRRLEHRFLLRFAETVHLGHGLLFYLVPYSVLKVSGEYLSRHFLDLRAWRLPAPHFESFGQVLVVGRRIAALPSNESVRSKLEAWGEDPSTMPVLPEVCPDPITIQLEDCLSFHFHPTLTALDLHNTVEGFRPWQDTPVGTDLAVRELLGARFHTAMPPKAAHIALALSSGMFNGHRLEPEDPSRHPPVLAKGVFERRLMEVSERTNKDGEVTGTVEVEQPSLRLTVLRLDTYEYRTLAPGVVAYGGDDPAKWNAADLIENYRGSLVDLLRRQFPPLHDPVDSTHQLALPELARKPFRAQSQAIQAALKLLARGENPFLVAEVGTGKTTMALILAAALSPEHRSHTVEDLSDLGFPTHRLPTVRRTLVLCPPHLLESWRNEAAAVLPEARVKILRKPSDLEADADLYILSRETAKLGHRLRGLEGTCPRCGFGLKHEAKANASRRLRCTASLRKPANTAARLAEILATALLPAAPKHALVRSLTPHRWLVAWLRAHPSEKSLSKSRLRTFHGPLLKHTVEAMNSGTGSFYSLIEILKTITRLAGLETSTAEQLLAPPSGGESEAYPHRYAREVAEELLRNEESPIEEPLKNVLGHLETLYSLSKWNDLGQCDEPLYQAVPEPRRYPLAKYIQKRYPEKFDLLVADEVHEFSNARSAQTHALHRLVSLNIPTIVLTGSLMGGYSSSLFANFWALSPRFRNEFERGDQRAFVDRYGYRKMLVTEPKEESEQAGERGVTTDRELRPKKNLGEAPGVMPTFLMQHLLPVSLLVHKDDLDHELPSKTETPVPIIAGDDPRDQELLAEHARLQDILLDQIRSDRFSTNAGKLLGALVELPSYLDRATGDLPAFRVGYPKSMGLRPLAVGKSFPENYCTPKERWLLGELRQRLAVGEKVLVFLRHTGVPHLPQRLLRLVKQQVTSQAVWLDAKKVPASKRQAWIDEHVLARDVQVLFVNPDAVRTGLNNLVTFSTAIWYELHYSATTYRQANGRLHRIGQVKPVSVLFPFYSGTAQEVALDLVARKVSASLQVDGLDVRAALEAAGACDSEEDLGVVMALGEAVYRALVG